MLCYLLTKYFVQCLHIKYVLGSYTMVEERGTHSIKCSYLHFMLHLIPTNWGGLTFLKPPLGTITHIPYAHTISYQYNFKSQNLVNLYSC